MATQLPPASITNPDSVTAVEKALDDFARKQPPRSASAQLRTDKSFAPAEARGIHDLVAELEELWSIADQLIKLIGKRLAEFDRAQAQFYAGKPR